MLKIRTCSRDCWRYETKVLSMHADQSMYHEAAPMLSASDYETAKSTIIIAEATTFFNKERHNCEMPVVLMPAVGDR